MKNYQIKISNTFATLGHLNNTEDINMGWENIKENIKTSAKESLGQYELKQHKPQFDKKKRSVGFLDQRKQANMQWFNGYRINTKVMNEI